MDEQKLQQEHEKLLVQQRELELQDKRLYAAIKNNQRIKQEVSGYEARRAACEAEYSLINSLSATLNGTLTGKNVLIWKPMCRCTTSIKFCSAPM